MSNNYHLRTVNMRSALLFSSPIVVAVCSMMATAM